MFKKLIAGILLSTTIFTSAGVYAYATYEEDVALYESQIAECQSIKEDAHQMAELARKFGFSEDSEIILFAKDKWVEANNRQDTLQTELDALILENSKPVPTWTGPKLTRSKGVNYGPNGKETYYNLNMSGVVRIMRNKGYSEAEYPYWVRSDGCKMLGDYIMLAANFSHWPRGSVVECSLGWGLVCDTGYLGYNHLDIATNW